MPTPRPSSPAGMPDAQARWGERGMWALSKRQRHPHGCVAATRSPRSCFRAGTDPACRNPDCFQPCCTHQCSDHDSLLAGSRAGRRPRRQAPMPQCAAKGASALPRNPQPSPPASLPVTTQSGVPPGQWHPNAQGAGFRPSCCPECVLRLACMHTRSQQKLVHMSPLQAKPHPVQPRTSHHL